MNETSFILIGFFMGIIFTMVISIKSLKKIYNKGKEDGYKKVYDDVFLEK